MINIKNTKGRTDRSIHVLSLGLGLGEGLEKPPNEKLSTGLAIRTRRY